MKNNPTFKHEFYFDFFGEHLMNAQGAPVVPEQWLGTTELTDVLQLQFHSWASLGFKWPNFTGH